MIAKIEGQVVAIMETKTKAEGKPYRVVSVLQTHDRGADIVRVNLWNGQKAESGKAFSSVVNIRAFAGSRGGVMLSADAY